MSKKVIVFSTSPRKNSNSDTLAEEFARGARDAGHEVSFVRLSEKNIAYCKGCLACQKTHACVIKDDAAEILRILQSADVVAFATPVYFYDMCGQMKTMIDRTNPLYPAEYAFREVYLLATAGDSSLEAVDGTAHGLQGWLDCFDKARLKGVVRGVGLHNPGDVRNVAGLCEQAYGMGHGC